MAIEIELAYHQKPPLTNEVAMTCDHQVSGMQSINRSDVAGVRKTLASLGAVVAEVDEQLRYVWIDNPHPDFDPRSVVGLRDDELIPTAEAEEIMALKREAFERQAPISRILSFRRSDGICCYSLFAYPIFQASGKIESVLTVAFDTLPSES